MDVSTRETYTVSLGYKSNRTIGFLRPGRPQEQLAEEGDEQCKDLLRYVSGFLALDLSILLSLK